VDFGLHSHDPIDCQRCGKHAIGANGHANRSRMSRRSVPVGAIGMLGLVPAHLLPGLPGLQWLM
jgi:hypothetical protein